MPQRRLRLLATKPGEKSGLDLIVEEKIIVEIKAMTDVSLVDRQQLLTYLRLRDVHLGLLINFNVPKLVDGIHRIVNRLEE